MLALLAPLASLLGIEIGALREKLQRQAIIYGIAGALAAICIAFLLVALHASLSEIFGPVVAGLVIAGVALLLALIVMLIGWSLDAAQQRRLAEERATAQKAGLITSVAMTAVPTLLKSSFIREVGIPLGGALLAAYLISRGSGKGTSDPDKR